MAVALVNHTKAGSASPAASSPGVDTTGATIEIVGSITNASHALTDSRSNTWNALTQYGAGVYNVRPFYAGAGALITDALQTFTETGAGSTMAFSMGAFSGVATTSPLVAQNGNATGGATSIITGSATPSQAGDLVFAFLGVDSSASAIVFPSGFTPLDSVISASVRCYSAWMIAPSTAAINPVWSWTGTSFPGAFIVIVKAAAGPTPYTVRVIQGRGFSVPQLVRAASKILSHPVGNATPLVSTPRVITSKPPAVTPVRGKPSIVVRSAPSATPSTVTSPHRVIAAMKNAIAPWFTRGKVASPRAGALIAIPKYQTIRSGPPAVKPIDRRSSVTRPAAGAAATVPVVHRVVRGGPPPVKAIDRKSIVSRPASSAMPPVIPPRHRAIASSLRVLVRTVARAWRGVIGGPAPITSTVRAQLPTSILFADLSTSIDFADLSTTLYYLNDDGALSMFPLQFKQGTTGPVTFPLLGADGTPKDLTGASAITMTVTKPNGVAIIAARALAVAGAPTLGQVTWTRLAGDTAVDGGYGIEVRVVNADGTIEKFPDPDSAELVITPSPTL